MLPDGRWLGPDILKEGRKTSFVEWVSFQDSKLLEARLPMLGCPCDDFYSASWHVWHSALEPHNLRNKRTSFLYKVLRFSYVYMNTNYVFTIKEHLYFLLEMPWRAVQSYKKMMKSVSKSKNGTISYGWNTQDQEQTNRSQILHSNGRSHTSSVSSEDKERKPGLVAFTQNLFFELC